MYKNKIIVQKIAKSENAELVDDYELSKHHVFLIKLKNGKTIRQIVSRGSRQMYGIYENHIRSSIRRANRECNLRDLNTSGWDRSMA